MAVPRTRLPFRRCTHIGNRRWYLQREWFLAHAAAIVEVIVFTTNGVCSRPPVLRGLIDAIIPGNFHKFAVAVVRFHQDCPGYCITQAMAFSPRRTSASPQ